MEQQKRGSPPMVGTPIETDNDDDDDIPELVSVYPDEWLAQLHNRIPIGDTTACTPEDEPLFQKTNESINIYPIRYRQVMCSISSSLQQY